MMAIGQREAHIFCLSRLGPSLNSLSYPVIEVDVLAVFHRYGDSVPLGSMFIPGPLFLTSYYQKVCVTVVSASGLMPCEDSLL